MIMEGITFGCSQGRLVIPFNGQLQCFPKDSWQKEFEICSECGLNFIELLAERKHNPLNPLWSDDGLDLISKGFKKNGLKSYSACLDYIIDNSIFKNNSRVVQNVEYVIRFINKINKIGINFLVLPLLEESDFSNYKFKTVKNTLLTILEECCKFEIQLVIESIAPSDKLLELLDSINHPNLGCVFDTGNRFEMGESNKEIYQLAKFIKHVHLKDKRENLNVQIGSGCVDFLEILKILNEINYKGSFCFETNRGKNPSNTMRHNVNFINFLIKQI